MKKPIVKISSIPERAERINTGEMYGTENPKIVAVRKQAEELSQKIKKQGGLK